jgi:hypothetical protein
VAGSTTIRVKACGSGDEFKWTPLSGVPLYEGPFQLKNVQANQCLDNNGQGSVTGDVLLKSCQTGKAAQILFLDHYSQPDP